MIERHDHKILKNKLENGKKETQKQQGACNPEHANSRSTHGGNFIVLIEGPQREDCGQEHTHGQSHINEVRQAIAVIDKHQIGASTGINKVVNLFHKISNGENSHQTNKYGPHGRKKSSDQISIYERN